jgi:CTP synthase (UTP-ammonia lyase)
MTGAVRVGIIGDLDPDRASHKATNEALEHAAGTLGVSVDTEWLPTALDSRSRRTPLGG